MTMTAATDRIEYTQGTFRQLLMAMANPGQTSRIESPSDLPTLSDISPYAFGLALTLLDQEVTFHIDRGTDADNELLRLYTMAATAEPSSCDYLFGRGSDSFPVSELKIGDLNSPERSCTVICQVRELGEDPIEGDRTVLLQLRGPGIADVSHIYVDGLRQDMLKQWQEVNSEFPLGLDWIFLDSEGRLCAVPRSSRLEYGIPCTE